MLGKKFGSMKNLAKKAKLIRTTSSTNIHHDQSQHLENLLVKDHDHDDQYQGASPTSAKSSKKMGTFAVYVGEERERFAVPTSYLSHPLFKILLEKTQNEFGFEQTNGLVVPCSVAAFQEVVNAVECCNGKFDFGDLVEEFL
ncbi:auxin-induced protein 15A [Lycium ferocissimum]|uniref:auxin-induced protein 15A n=1 Tax=Lycium ferocissimum TaxID=112874 RepID=UPI002814ECAB|nr:auxin-induced protein 15A [Lycium ferocissimum]